MGSYLYNTALLLFLLIIYVMFHETQLYQEHIQIAKMYVEESAAAGSQYFIDEDYADGYYNFKEDQSIKAIESSLKTNFQLDEEFTPKTGYWTEQFEYEVTFIDYDSPKYHGFPANYEFTHFGTTYETTISGPSVIVTINTGEQRYNLRFLSDLKKDNFVTGIHTFEE